MTYLCLPTAQVFYYVPKSLRFEMVAGIATIISLQRNIHVKDHQQVLVRDNKSTVYHQNSEIFIHWDDKCTCFSTRPIFLIVALIHWSGNWASSKPTILSTTQMTNQSFNQPTKWPTNQMTDQPYYKPNDQLTNKATVLETKRPTNWMTN